jgi:hypothetical protein
MAAGMARSLDAELLPVRRGGYAICPTGDEYTMALSVGWIRLLRFIGICHACSQAVLV